MLILIIRVIKLFIVPLFYSKKEIILKYSIMKLENDILKRRLDLQNKKPIFNQIDRVFYAIISKLSSKIRSLVLLIQPETILEWYRNITKDFWNYPKKKPGRPPVSTEIKNLILKTKNSTKNVGYGQIQGELLKLGIKLSERTTARILQDFRKKGKIKNTLSWSKFIQSHLKSLHTMDFFTVDSILGIRFYVFFVMHINTREIVMFDIPCYPSKNFVQQCISDLTWDKKECIYLLIIYNNFSSFLYIRYKSFNTQILH